MNLPQQDWVEKTAQKSGNTNSRLKKKLQAQRSFKVMLTDFCVTYIRTELSFAQGKME